MASRLRRLAEERFGDWSIGRAVSVLMACALLGLTVECQPGRAQSSTSHPPVIATSTQWALDAPKLASTNASGVSGNSFSLHPNFSPDGTHLLFWSASTNLPVPGAGNGNEQLYIKDLRTGAIALVSGNTSGDPGNAASLNPNNSSQVLMFSPDGTRVAFESGATNLSLGATNGSMHIFVKDLTTGAVTLVSADANGIQGNNSSQNFSLSPDGTKVVFGSSATNLLANPTLTTHIFVKDLGTGSVTLVSTDGNGAEGDGASSFPVFSPDGTEVAFVSKSTNLAAGANNGNSEIYVKNLLTGAVTLVSTDANGVPGNGPSLLPMFSPDGSKVAFHSSSSNLTPGTSGNSEVYVKDLAGGAITLISTDINGAAANSNDSMLAVFSPDGTKVAFESSATNLVPSGTSGQQVFVKDLLTGEVTLMSADTNGVQGNSPSSDPNFSPDHKAVAFQSMAGNLGVTNGTFGILVRPIFTASGAAVDHPSATTLTTAGQLSFSDPDTSDTHTASVASQTGNLGTLAVSVAKDTAGTGTGGVISWDYQVDETLVHALNAAATDAFTLTLTDSQGCTATTAIVVTALPQNFAVANAGNGNTSSPTSTSSCPTLAVITSPSDLTVTAGQAASFSAAANGTPAPSVQWQVSTDGGANFSDLPGATATTLTFTASLSQNGNLYRAVFTNVFGTAASSTALLTVTNTETTTVLASSQNPSVFGQAVTFSVSVSSHGATPTGTVAFLDGATGIGTGPLDPSGRATFTISSLAVGTHSIMASYGGNTNFSASSSSPLSQIVSKDTTTMTLNSSANPSVFGQPLVVTATVSAAAPGAGVATGAVSFQDGATSLGTANLLNGQASITVSTLGVGPHSLTAAYSGDGNFNTSTSAVAQTVNKASTATSLSSSANPASLNQAVTFTATVGAAVVGAGTPGGTVRFNDGTTTLATVPLSSNGTATFSTSTLGVKSHGITAVYSGDDNFNGSSGGLTQNVQYSICAQYDQTRSVHGGATFPIKIQLCDVDGNDVSASSITVHATAVIGVSGTSGPPEDAGNANPDDDFRFKQGFGPTGGYIFNLSTDGLATGTYALQFSVSGDPVLHTVMFGVK